MGVRVSLVALKRVEAVAWSSAPNFISDLAQEIAYESVLIGDDAAARNYLREALGAEKQTLYREMICSRLAWLEEDPEVSTALLQESCADDLFLNNAVCLSILTGSDDSADYYFKRWLDGEEGREITARWLKSDSLCPEIEAWKKRHATKSAD